MSPRGTAASDRSRIGFDEPTTSSASPGRASTSARARRRPPGAPGASSAASSALAAARSASSQRAVQPRGGFHDGADPTARTVPGTSVQLRPCGSARAYTATRRSASSRWTGRCRVGRPATSTCVGSSASGSAPSSHGPARRPTSHTPDAGSAITGSPHPRTSVGAPAPAMTSVGAAGSSGSGSAWTRARETAVHGPPPGRPAGGVPASGTSGSANGRFRCTGPGGVPSAAASIRPTADRHGPFSRSGSLAGAAVSARRTAPPKIPGWTTVWFAPVPISCGGRSAVSTSSGTPACDASSTAGCRFATAVPDVVTTGTARPERSARPSARNPAVRSSMRTCRRSRPAVSAAWRANASGALREPGQSTASVTPPRTSSSTITWAWAVDGFTAPRLVNPAASGPDQLERGGEGRAARTARPSHASSGV